jgi:hypothetical protein
MRDASLKIGEVIEKLKDKQNRRKRKEPVPKVGG